MQIVQECLQQMMVSKPQAKFMTVLLRALLVVRGKVNYSNLSRYTCVCEKTLRRWFARPFDFEAFNQLFTGLSGKLLLAIDASFLPKSGKCTYGLDWFWNGCLGRTQKGLEVSVIALVDFAARTAYALSARQTPAQDAEPHQGSTATKSRVDHYLEHLTEVVPYLPPGVTCAVCDAYYVKKKFVDGALALGLDIISKLRLDADMRFLYHGPQKPRGRRRIYGDKVSDLTGFERAGMLEDGVLLFTALVHHQSLKRVVRVVLLQSNSSRGLRQALLFSTDTTLTAAEIVEYYTARFQIEFLLRDAKQFTGLADCQARNQAAIHCHVNASLMAVNLAKLQARRDSGGEEPFVFSLASAKHRAFNTHLLDLIIERLGLEPALIKSHPNYPSLRDYGTLAA